LSEAHLGSSSQAPFEPQIDTRQFTLVVSSIGQKAILKHFTDQVCTCYDTITSHADPSCPLCEGKGRIIQTLMIRGILREHLPHGIYRASTITIGGENPRHDAIFLIHPKYDKKVQIGDFIIIDDIKYRIINKVKRRVTKGKPLYIRLEMFKVMGE